jgi:hypothetical protein
MSPGLSTTHNFHETIRVVVVESCKDARLGRLRGPNKSASESRENAQEKPIADDNPGPRQVRPPL